MGNSCFSQPEVPLFLYSSSAADRVEPDGAPAAMYVCTSKPTGGKGNLGAATTVSSKRDLVRYIVATAKDGPGRPRSDRASASEDEHGEVPTLLGIGTGIGIGITSMGLVNNTHVLGGSSRPRATLCVCVSTCMCLCMRCAVSHVRVSHHHWLTGREVAQEGMA